MGIGEMFKVPSMRQRILNSGTQFRLQHIVMHCVKKMNVHTEIQWCFKRGKNVPVLTAIVLRCFYSIFGLFKSILGRLRVDC